MNDSSLQSLLKIKSENKKVQVLVVTKNQSFEQILPLITNGHTLFGENKVIEARQKWSEARQNFPSVRLDFIGHLQTNKAKDAVLLFDRIHSLDSLKLAFELQKWERTLGKKLKYFLQINIGREPQKYGIVPEDVGDFIKNCPLEISGLMCIPPVDCDPLPFFITMNELKVLYGLEHLSMGMSSDFKLAIQNGATIIRLGSSIFQKNVPRGTF
jgi:pyridoxal phosphate enzyme (YggS family)